MKPPWKYFVHLNWIRPMSCIITENLLLYFAQSTKWSKKHGGFWRLLTPFPWQPLRNSHAITTDQPQSWNSDNVFTPVILAVFLVKNIIFSRILLFFYNLEGIKVPFCSASWCNNLLLHKGWVIIFTGKIHGTWITDSRKLWKYFVNTQHSFTHVNMK